MCPIRMVKLYVETKLQYSDLQKVDYSLCVVEQSKVTPTDRTHA